MARTIGIMVQRTDEARRKKTDEICAKLGFETRYLESGFSPESVRDCEIIHGGIPYDMIKHCESMKWMQCSYAGVDGILTGAELPPQPFVMTNAAGAFGITISEYILCTLLMMMRHMPQFIENQKKSLWFRDPNLDTRSIYKSTITILGTGDLGGNIAKRAKAMGAFIRGVRKNIAKGKPEYFDEIYSAEDIDSAISGADVVILCLPSTKDTVQILDAKRISLMADNSYVVNVGRGNAVNAADLIAALESEKLAGAVLDVTDPEPLPESDPLWKAKNLLLTPHVSGNMSLNHTVDIIWDIFYDNLKKYCLGEPLTHIVDMKAGY